MAGGNGRAWRGGEGRARRLLPAEGASVPPGGGSRAGRGGGGPPRPPAAWSGTSARAARCPRPRRKGRAPWKGSLPLPPALRVRTFRRCRCYLLKRFCLAFFPPCPKKQGDAMCAEGQGEACFFLLPPPAAQGLCSGPFWVEGKVDFTDFSTSRSPLLKAVVVSLTPAVI